MECSPVAGAPVPAEQVLADLRDGKDVQVRGRVIEGSLDVANGWPAPDESRPSLPVVFGRLVLESCRVAGRVAFPKAVFARGLELPCTEIRGDLDLTDADVRGGLNASRSIVLGDAKLVRASVSGDLVLRGARIGGALDLSGSRVGRSLLLDTAEIAGNLDLSKSVTGDIDAAFISVGGPCRLEDLLVAGALRMSGATFARGFAAESVRTVDNADFREASSSGEFTLKRLAVGQNLLIGLSAERPVVLSEVAVVRDLSLLDGRYGALTADNVRVGRLTGMDGARFAGKVLLRQADFGASFTAVDAYFAGDCEFRGVRFPGNDPLEGALFARAPSLIDTLLPRPPSLASEAEEGPPTGEEDEPQDEGEE